MSALQILLISSHNLPKLHQHNTHLQKKIKIGCKKTIK